MYAGKFSLLWLPTAFQQIHLCHKPKMMKKRLWISYKGIS